MINEFDEIRPFEPSEMREAFNELLDDRQFKHVLKSVTPWLPKILRNGLLRLAFTGIKTPLDFQKRFMKPVVWHIIRQHTKGCTFDDSALNDDSKFTKRYTFLSNHRDIVLDSVLCLDESFNLMIILLMTSLYQATKSIRSSEFPSSSHRNL